MTGLSVRGVYSNEEIELPTAFTCTKVYLNSYAHTIPYACEFPPNDSQLPVLALIGRDYPSALPFQFLTEDVPFVGKSKLGYTLVGDSCPNEAKDTGVQLAFLNQPHSGFDVFSKRRDDEVTQEDK